MLHTFVENLYAYQFRLLFNLFHVFILDTHVCPSMYRCKGSHNCIPLSNVCDRRKHCVNGDDEMYCGIKCPDVCTCEVLYYDCSGVGLREPPSEISTEVRKLNLSYNEIKIKPRMFRAYSYLRTLSLRNSQIKDVYKDSFHGMSNLLWLDLRNNIFDRLPVGTFDGLIRLETLLLDWNSNLALIDTGAFRALNKLIVLNVSHSGKFESSLNHTFASHKTIHNDNFEQLARH